MADGKSIALLAAVAAFAGIDAWGARSAAARPESAPYQVAQIDAHMPVTYHFAVTNMTDKTQKVESVRTSCACLKVDMGARRVEDNAPYQNARMPPGGVLPLDVIFNPAGMEGRVEKRVWVTLAPSKKIVTFDVAADVRLRLGFKPMDAAFGVIRRNETGREIVAKLSGYVADGAKLGTPCIIKHRGTESQRNGDEVNPVKTNSLSLCASVLKEEVESVFDVRLGEDGKSLVVKFRERNVLPGLYSETWTIPTSDKEIPEIKFAVSARVADGVSVSPQVITVGWDEPVCSRMVMVRGGNGQDARCPSGGERNGQDARCPSGGERNGQDARCPSILSAETKPRNWGDVKITPRPKNGWRIDIANIDPREVRQFSKRPFLEVKTNLPEMESFEIPLRVVNDGGVK